MVEEYVISLLSGFSPQTNLVGLSDIANFGGKLIRNSCHSAVNFSVNLLVLLRTTDPTNRQIEGPRSLASGRLGVHVVHAHGELPRPAQGLRGTRDIAGFSPHQTKTYPNFEWPVSVCPCVSVSASLSLSLCVLCLCARLT